MSIKLMSLAWESSLPSTEKMVLLSLCDFANDDGKCWPSVATLARKCSKGERTIQKALASLEGLGILDREERDGTSTVYRIHPRKFCTPAENAPPQKLHPTPANSAPPPPQKLHPNHQGTIKEPSNIVRKPDDLDKQIWDDWKRVRKKPVTPTVIKRIENEAAKIGWTLSQAITCAAENSWQGFKADWVDAPAKQTAPAKREPMTGQDWLAHCKRQLANAERFHGLYEIEQWRAKVADAERKLGSGRGGGQIGDLVENIMLDAQKDGG